jgi:hypothetical protein
MIEFNNGKLRTYEKNCMSLSCDGSVIVKDGIITEVNFKGYPRPNKDAWTHFYRTAKRGDILSSKTKKAMLSYNGHNNIESYYEESK